MQVVYHGSYLPLRGQQMSEAYRSVVDLSLSTKAGLLIRQTHHWAANVFLAAIILHLFRVFFTGAYRKPRDLTYYIGVTMLIARAARGVPGLLARRRPHVGHGALHRLLGRTVDPVRRREPHDAGSSAGRSRASRASGRASTSRTCCSSRS